MLSLHDMQCGSGPEEYLFAHFQNPEYAMGLMSFHQLSSSKRNSILRLIPDENTVTLHMRVLRQASTEIDPWLVKNSKRTFPIRSCLNGTCSAAMPSYPLRRLGCRRYITASKLFFQDGPELRSSST